MSDVTIATRGKTIVPLYNAGRGCQVQRQASLVLGNVQVRFVQRQWFYQVRVTGEDLAHAMRDRPVAAKSGGTKIPSGHRRSARTAGMAERTPKCLASYEAAHTTERVERQAMITGLPCSRGSSRCSTEA